LAPAQILDEISIDVCDASGEVLRHRTISVGEYCQYINDHSSEFGRDMTALARALYDYGKAAAEYFGYNAAAYTEDYFFNSADFTAFNNGTPRDGTGKVTEVSYVATSEPSLRFKMNLTEKEVSKLKASSTIGNAYFAKRGTDIVLVVDNIPTKYLNREITVTVNGLGTIVYTPMIYANVVARQNNSLGRLGISIANMNLAANNKLDIPW
jgi:hypothetical protein